MPFSVITIIPFERESKRLVKKYKSLKSELLELVRELKYNPFQGTAIGNNCYKIRISIASKNKGKSGGGRVITHIAVIQKTVYLLSVYDKSEKQDLEPKELKQLLEQIPT